MLLFHWQVSLLVYLTCDVMVCFRYLGLKSRGNGSFRFLGWNSQVKLLCMFVAGVFAVCVTA